MDISGRGLGGEARAQKLSHERPSELQRSTSWEVTQKWKGCLRVMDNAWDRATFATGATMDLCNGRCGAVRCGWCRCRWVLQSMHGGTGTATKASRTCNEREV
jgi:hypothetical protein